MPSDSFVDQLVDDLVPVAAFRPMPAFLLATGAAGVGLIALAATAGLRADLLHGRPAIATLIVAALLLLVATATLVNAIGMARPAVGRRHGGWGWAVAAIAVVPLVAMIDAFSDPAAALPAIAPHFGLICLGVGLAAGALVMLALTLALRRGAPTSAERAGWLIGLAAGASGAVSVTLACSIDHLAHSALWHVGTVAVAGAVGRLALPPLLRW